jgi:hypothetical protein
MLFLDIFNIISNCPVNSKYPLAISLKETPKIIIARYILTNRFNYPPREPSTFDKSDKSLTHQNICVPIEKYLADMVDDRFFSGKVSRTCKKKRSKRKMRYSNKKK